MGLTYDQVVLLPFNLILFIPFPRKKTPDRGDITLGPPQGVRVKEISVLSYKESKKGTKERKVHSNFQGAIITPVVGLI